MENKEDLLDLDYRVLKLIYNNEEELNVGDIAKMLSIPHSTAGSCVKRLADKGYLIYKQYKNVRLSDKGSDLAIELIRHSQLLEVLLYNELGLSVEDAHREAEKFNLLFSCNTINKICEKYGHPKLCPCGEEILSTPECFCTLEDQQ